MREFQRLHAPIRRDIAMACLDHEGQPLLLPCLYVYDELDPFAVTIVFRVPGAELPWSFSRDLLVLGQAGPVGEGDVRVWPGLDSVGQPVLAIRFSSPDGELVAEVALGDVRAFLADTEEMVPRGTERAHLDLDALIEELLSSVG